METRGWEEAGGRGQRRETEIETDDQEYFEDSCPVRHQEPEKSLFGTKV